LNSRTSTVNTTINPKYNYLIASLSTAE
jgi:hypothetical protein